MTGAVPLVSSAILAAIASVALKSLLESVRLEVSAVMSFDSQLLLGPYPDVYSCSGKCG